mmetsp:Transcript_21351/g.55489  ORF Transcript_21351/g.55489 Transcript_21351/m.55489 type:complete len:207 (-) Transcript_21351:1794-2414(-)|eukprot:CAMPEP_0113906392 /NCGR_PEP_ID=MMETSP0780_2-20120614/24712_1 /TAXON_ID=652834 /ORGANISM="Palpitomonas bilix" /LENGTH=206 /DNA_ID=CAMNT_0000900967 /DNA_START=71 /DNA_END=691 /DNA_ORIENTATION=+ /assembly_acc=CAM_ASM_000599
MAPHGHGHGCKHEHEDDGVVAGEASSLYGAIDFSRVFCLNEDPCHPGKAALKPTDRKRDVTEFLLSDADEEVILHIPFSGDVKLKGITIFGGGSDESPREMRAFVNREDVDFETAQTSVPVQKWDLAQEASAELEYITTAARFSNLSSLTLFFPSNFGAEHTKIYYVGLRGQHMKIKREAVNAIYEARPLAKEQDVKRESHTSWGL